MACIGFHQEQASHHSGCRKLEQRSDTEQFHVLNVERTATLTASVDKEEKTKVEVKAIWEVQSDFTVQVVLLSVGKGFTEREREALKVMTERTRKEIETVLGENTIPFIYVDGEC